MHPKEKLLFNWLSKILPAIHQNYGVLDSLNTASVGRLRYKNAADLLRPSAIIRHAVLNGDNDNFLDIQLPSDSLHIDRVLKRDIRLGSFFQEVNRIIKRVFPSKECSDIEFLAGDSHNGGRRPVRLVFGKEKYVLKFAEPRAYQVLVAVTNFVSEKTKISMEMPPLIASDAHEGWYIIPFIDEEQIIEKGNELGIQKFMYNIGALTALAYSLSMVDAHIENVIIWKDHPIIIDPECILYLMSEMPQDDKLLSTGLLSHNIHVSALRGGGVPMRSMGQTLDSEGVLRYYHPATGLRNRLNVCN
jgi:hypothetical protein